MTPLKRFFFDGAPVVLALALSLGAHTTLKPGTGLVSAVLIWSAVALLWRRSRPMTVAWITAALAWSLPVLDLFVPGGMQRPDPDPDHLIMVWPPAGMFAVYAVLVYAEGRKDRWIPAALIGSAALAVGYALEAQGTPEGAPSAVVFRSVSAIACAALLGLYVGSRRRELQGLRERAERAERERHLLAEQARAEERARLAAEMHDVVTHRVTLMVMQAGALRVTTKDGAVRKAAEELRVTGCLALEELRDVVGLLRREPSDEDLETVPDLRPLLGETDHLIEEGNPAMVSPVVGRTAHRIVREALTNARKHAPGARVEVRVAYRTDGVRLTVRNAGATRPLDPEVVATGSGAGLTGLRQRVELVGGSLEARGDGQGFLVEALLPAYVEAP